MEEENTEEKKTEPVATVAGCIAFGAALFSAIWVGLAFAGGGFNPIGIGGTEPKLSYVVSIIFMLLSSALCLTFDGNRVGPSGRERIAALSTILFFGSLGYAAYCVIPTLFGGGAVKSYGHYLYHLNKVISVDLMADYWIETRVQIHLISMSLIACVVTLITMIATMGHLVVENEEKRAPNEENRLERYQRKLAEIIKKEKPTEEDVLLAATYRGRLNANAATWIALTCLFFIVPATILMLEKMPGDEGSAMLFYVGVYYPLIGLLALVFPISLDIKMSGNWEVHTKIAEYGLLIAGFVAFGLLAYIGIQEIRYVILFKVHSIEIYHSLAGNVELTKDIGEMADTFLSSTVGFGVTLFVAGIVLFTCAGTINLNRGIHRMNYRYLSQK